jgi:hypothetical protein
MIAMYNDDIDLIVAYAIAIIFTLLIIISIPVFFYQSTRVDVYDLEAIQQNIMFNYKTLTLNMNKVAVVKYDTNKIIVDFANFKQSTNTSEALIAWVSNANEFNRSLAREKAKREGGVFSKLWYGWRYPLSNTLKFIEVKL